MCGECVVTDAWMSYSQRHTSLSVGVTMRTQGAGGLVHRVLITGHRVDGILMKAECVYLPFYGVTPRPAVVYPKA